jgi:hypothetical protein
VHRNVQVVQREYASPCLGALPDSPATFETMKLLLTEEFQHGIVQKIKEFVPSPDPGTKRYRHAERSPPAPRDDDRGAPPRPAVPRSADRERREEPAARPAQPPADTERRDEPAARPAQPPAERSARTRIRRDSEDDLRIFFAGLSDDELDTETSSRKRRVLELKHAIRECVKAMEEAGTSDDDLIRVSALQSELETQELELRVAMDSVWVRELRQEYEKLPYVQLENRLDLFQRIVTSQGMQIKAVEEFLARGENVHQNTQRLADIKESRRRTELKVSLLRDLVGKHKPSKPSPIPEVVTDSDDDDTDPQQHLESMLQTTHRLEDVIPPDTHAGELVEEIDKALLEVKDLWTPLTGITTIQAERVKQALTEVAEYNTDLYTTAVQDFPEQDSGEIRRLSKDLSTETDQLNLDIARALLSGLQATRAQDLWNTSPRLYKAWLHAQRA